jgi:diguanylate cyclase (GGDEF)-like protein
MIAAPIPQRESIRLAALNSTGLLGTPDEYVLDRVTHIGANLFSAPICLLSLADAERQWFKSCVGLDLRETSREISFCGHVVASGEMLVVEDAWRDHRFEDNPLVLAAPNIRFYAGCPIRDPSGEILGTLCIIDFRPRAFNHTQRTLLRELAAVAELSLSARHVSVAQKSLVAGFEVARRESMVDPLLRIWNRCGLDALVEQQNAAAIASGATFSLMLMDIDYFERINDTYGNEVGDAVLKAVVHALRSTLRSGDELGRFGADEFLAILPDANADSAARLAQRLQESIGSLRVETPVKARGCTVSIGCTISIGIAERDSEPCGHADALVHRAEAELLAAKQNGILGGLPRRRAMAQLPVIQGMLEN